MALITDKSVFLHIPKTGGMFVRHIFKACKIQHFELGDQHSTFNELLKYQSLDFFKNRFVFAFVRHPLTWYQSRWAFRMKYGWQALHQLDFNCASNDFKTFVNNAIRFKPSGWVTHEYNNFIGAHIDFVGRIEFMVNDLMKAMRLAGEPLVEKVIRTANVVNDSTLDGIMPQDIAVYDRDLYDKVINVEHRVISSYYSTYTPALKVL